MASGFTDTTVPKLIWVRVAVPVVGTALLFLAAALFYYLPAARDSLLQQKKDGLRNLVHAAWGAIDACHQLEREGTLSAAQARHRAAEVISRMRFGPEGKDYFWINDLDSRMVMHPWLPDLNGRDMSGFTDMQGKRLFLEFADVVRRDGQGFVSYHWQWKDDPERIEPKLSFVRIFEPWGWIVGGGVYLDDLASEAAMQRRRLMGAGLVVFLLALLLALVSIRQGRQADARLRRSHATMRAVFDQSFQFMALLDLSGRVVEVNDTALAQYGLQKKDVRGKLFGDTPWWTISEDIRSQLRENISGAAHGQGVCWQTAHPDGRGGRLDILFSLKPALDAQGQPFGILAEGQDVTEQVHARQERERTLRDLAVRNEELERVAAVVSHDLRNPVVTITGFAGVLREALSTGEQDRATLALERIDLAAGRIAGLLKDLALLFRVERLEPALATVNMQELVAVCVRELQPQLETVGGEVAVGPLPEVWGDADRLRQVVSHLLANALLFARENVPLRVAVGCVASAEWYEFYVQDNGQGIRKAYLERIFDIFEQLVPNRRGTGMGLTLVRRIVEQHGGRVWAESEGEGRGTEIRFTLPRTDLPEDLMRKNFGPPRGTDDDLPNVL